MFIKNYGDMKIGNFQQYLISYRLKSPLFSQVSPVYRKTRYMMIAQYIIKRGVFQ